MAAAPLSKDDINVLIGCIDRAIKGDKVQQARTTSPLMKEAVTQQIILYEKLKQKLLGV